MKQFVRLITLGGVLILFGQLCPWLGSLHGSLELISHFQLQFFIGAIIFLGLSILASSWRNAAFHLMLTGLGCFHLSPYWGDISVPASEQNEQTAISVVSYNLLSYNEEKEAACDYLEQVNPDILAVYEINSEWAEILHQHFPNYRGISQLQEDNFGIALISRWPIKILHQEAPSETGNLLLHAVVQTPQGNLEIIACHPIPPGGSRTAARDQYLSRAVELAKESSRPLILLGDLNVTRWSPSYRQLFAKSSLKNAQDGRGLSTTWSPLGWPVPGLELDHLFATEGITLTAFGRGEKSGSDHTPIEARLHLP